METLVPLAPAIQRYFRALEGYNVEDAVNCFAPDVFYSHPPYPNAFDSQFFRGPDLRLEVRSRAELRQLLADRGAQPFGYRIHAAATEGNTTFVTGHVYRDGALMSSFISYAVLDDAGLIERYETYSSTPPVGEDPTPD
jgi:hypothetical protein